MNGTDDFIGILEDYLDDFDGATPLPDHVRDSIHAALPGTRQARPATGSRRLLIMLSNTSARARWGLAAAAIVVAVVVGGAFITGNQNQLGVVAAPATPTPTPTPTPTIAPSATLTHPLLGLAPTVPCPVRPKATCIEPGRYQLTSATNWPTTISLDVPEGWWEYYPENILGDYDGVLVDGPAPDGSGWGMMFMTVGDVSRDPCDPKAKKFEKGDVDSPAELAAAMATWPGFEATTPEAITVGGVDGLLVELTSARTMDQCPEGWALLWTTVAGARVDTYPMVDQDGLGRPGQYRILDVDGQLIVVWTSDFPEASPFEVSQGLDPDAPLHTADQVELQAIVDSIRFGDPQP